MSFKSSSSKKVELPVLALQVIGLLRLSKWIIFEQSQRWVAKGAKEPADPVRAVDVVHVKPATFRLSFADCANSILPVQPRRVFLFTEELAPIARCLRP